MVDVDDRCGLETLALQEMLADLPARRAKLMKDGNDNAERLTALSNTPISGKKGGEHPSTSKSSASIGIKM